MTESESVVSDSSDGAGMDAAGNWVLNLGDAASDVGFYISAVLECTVAERIKGAIFKDNPVEIAERLVPFYMTADKADIFRVPGDIFTVNN